MEKMSKNIYFMIIFVLTAVLYFAYLGNIDLWNPDEPRYVEVVREMFSLKHFIVPHLNGEIYGDKPPLFFWSMAFFVKIFHSMKEWIFRLTPAISGFLMVIITYLYSQKLFNKNTGFFSAVILSTSYLFTHLSRRCNIDTFFGLLILISIITLHYALKKDDKKFYYISFIFQGLAIITKGPLGFIIPLFTLIFYLIFSGEREKLKKVPWLTGFLIMIIPVLAWLIPATIIAGKDYTYNLIMNHVIHRFEHGRAHPHNFFYYFYQFPLDFMPWSLFIPFAFIKGKNFLKDKNILWFICWFGVNFLFLSISKEKRGLYLIPIYPAFAIIIGYLIDNINNWLKAKGDRLKENINEDLRFFKIPSYILIVISGLVGIAMPVAYFIKTKNENFSLLIMSILCIVVVIYSFKYIIRSINLIKIFTFIYLLIFINFFSLFSYMFPLANSVKSARYFVNELTKHINNFDDLLIYGYYSPGFNFYLKKDHLNVGKKPETLKNYITNQKISYILINRKTLKRQNKYISEYLKNYKQIWSRHLGHRKLILFEKKS